MKTNTVETIYRGSVLLIAFLIPSGFYGAILGVLAVTAICWFYCRDYTKIGKAIKRPEIFWPFLLYACVVGGFFFAHNFREAVSTLSTKAPFLLFPLFVGTASVVDKKLVDKAGMLIVLSNCIFIAIAIGYAFIDVWVSGSNTILLDGSIYNKYSYYGLTRVFNNWHPVYVAMFANLAVAIQVHNLFSRRITNRRLGLFMVVFVFLTIAILLLNSMIGLLAYCFNLIYAGNLLLNKLKLKVIPKVFYSVFTIMVGVLFFYFNPLNLEKIETLKVRGLKVTDSQGERNVLTMRLAKWDAHFQIVKSHWLLGVTEGDIKEVRKQAYLAKGYEDLAKYNYNAHNQYIEVLATYGSIGFTFFIGMLLCPLVKKNNHPYFFAFLIITAITFLTETVLNRQQGILAFMFLYALYTHPFSLRDRKVEFSTS